VLPLNIFGELERFTTEELYPHRYIITPILIAIGLAVLYGAYRLGVHRWIRRKPVVSAAVGLPLIVLSVVAGDYLVSPLWERKFLEEPSPLAAGAPAPAQNTVAVSGPTTQPQASPTQPPPDSTPQAPAETPASAPAEAPPPTIASGQASGGSAPGGGQQTSTFQARVVLTGTFMGADDFHFGHGDALIIETEPGVYVLRFENFSVRNGPDLFVYLSEDPSGEDVDEALNLGDLKATDGAFNYEIPPGVDVSRVKSAVVWCRQFSVLFAHAEFN
jgi:hypothetical protein